MYRLSMTPLTIETPSVLFDLSRLVRSRHKPFGTGVDRIDLAIGLDLVARFGTNCHFLHAGIHGICRLDHSLGRAVLSHLDAAWNGSPGERLEKSTDWRLSVMPFVDRMAQRLPRSIINRQTTYVVASHSGLGKVKGGMKRLDPKAEMKRVVYIHDLIPIDFPEYQRPQTYKQFTAYLDELFDAPVQVVANSKDTALRMQAYAAAQGMRLSGTEVIIPTLTFGAAASAPVAPAVRAVIEDPTPYFVTLGTIEPRKNHLLLLEIWRMMADRQQIPRLCIIGKRGWENENVIDMLERSPVIREHVLEFGGLGDHEVQLLLKGARALLFPSFAEGLGIPLLEAGALGVPAIVSDIPVFHEIAPSDTVFLNPIDGLGWMREILARSGEGTTNETEGQA
ncbi:glycosyltransferase involved in cell wall biosynthesis [Rhizobium sp. PP-CC-2G-626]|nr:glycosyltransferase involved in cell wall biosynthesis [Rhizobium sp. PP-CC-2G-626]